jgi:hypothetical protein
VAARQRTARPRESEDPAPTCQMERFIWIARRLSILSSRVDIPRWMPAFASMSGMWETASVRDRPCSYVGPGKALVLPRKSRGERSAGKRGGLRGLLGGLASSRPRHRAKASPSPLRSGEGASRHSTGGDFGSRARASGWGPMLQRRLSGRLPPSFSPTASSH